MQRLYAFSKNLAAVHHYLKHAYQEKRHAFTEGLSFFKEEFSGKLDNTGRYIDHVTLPINNFLKDIHQIEKEFKEEVNKSTEYCICIDGRMVPASEVLKCSVEENY